MDLDVVVLGTGLTESIVAAALSKVGYKVGHVDANSYYGADEASLSIDELVRWAEERNTSQDEAPSTYLQAQRERFTDISYFGSIPPQPRQYAVSLCPTIIPSIGPLIESLILSGVSRYGGFKLLEQVALYESPGVAKPVPGNKEDIFKNKQLGLLHKRRLMRFLMFAGGEFENKPELQGNEQTPFSSFLRAKFSLDDDAVKTITFALAFCILDTDPTLPALQRIRKYLRSTGRYGPSPFLFGHYGGVGEIAQGFCRTAAVAGATYILGRNIISAQVVDPVPADRRRYSLRLEDLDESIECDVLITSADYTEVVAPQRIMSSTSIDDVTAKNPIARCVAVIDQPLLLSGPHILSEATESPSEDNATEDAISASSEGSETDTAVVVFPPGSVVNGSDSAAVHALLTGEGSMSTPRGKRLLYISLSLHDDVSLSKSAEELLRPYLDAALTLVPKSHEGSVQPLFTIFYKQNPYLPPSSTTVPQASSLLPPPSDSIHLPEIADSIVGSAEATFWQAIEKLKGAGRRPQRKEGGGEQDEIGEIDSLWPPLEDVEEDQEEW